MTAIQQVVDALEALPTTAFLVLDRDRVVLDHGATTTPSYLASARKASCPSSTDPRSPTQPSGSTPPSTNSESTTSAGSCRKNAAPRYATC
jgi:hypothetical protein